MVKIYIHKINREKLLREESDIFRLLPEWRKEKVRKFKVESSRLQSLVAGRLLDLSLADYLDIDVTEVKWHGNQVDRQYHDEINNRVVEFSISHSGVYVAVALSDIPVGIDVEIKEDRDFKITNRIMTGDDKAYILSEGLTEEVRQMHFRDIWTIKESFLKCTGEGISVPLDSFASELYMPLLVRNEDDLISDSGVMRKIVSLGYEYKNNQPEEGDREYYVATTRVDGGICSLSICARDANLILDIKRVEVLV